MAALCLFLVDALKFEVTSTKTVAHLGGIASPHPASILIMFSRGKSQRSDAKNDRAGCLPTVSFCFSLQCVPRGRQPRKFRI
jgi:hypothetical protein